MDNIIVAASRNRHKIEEIEAITKKFGMSIISRDEAGVPPVEIEEDGETFEENYFKKADQIMKLCGKITLADDSGLMVDYLGGAPGVYSARFAGEDGNDEKNIEKLLDELKDVPQEKRGAKFVSAVCCCFPDGRSFTVRGECHGVIAFDKHGNGGFGYDPVFLVGDKTFGELSAEEKDKLSHRGNALRLFAEEVKKYIT